MSEYIEYGILTESGSYNAHTNKWEMGWAFTVGDEDINVCGLRIKLPAAQTSIGHLWSSSGTLLASVSITAVAGKWVEAYFAEAITLTAGKTYVISYYNKSTRYASTKGQFTFNPKITFVSGRYIDTQNAFPSNTEGDNVYPMIDIIIDTTPPYPVRFLVRKDGVLHTVTERTLTAIDATDLTAEVFLEHGFENLKDFVPEGEYSVLSWSSEQAPVLTATVTGPAPPQELTCTVDLSHSSITGIALLAADYGGTVLLSHRVEDGEWSEPMSLGEWVAQDCAALWASLGEDRLLHLRFTLYDGAELSGFKITYSN